MKPRMKMLQSRARHPPPPMPSPDLRARRRQFLDDYARIKKLSLSLDMTRGKPSAEQLDLSNALLSLPGGAYTAGGIDARNYGGLEGLPAVRELFAAILEVTPQNVLAGGNASLTLMYETLSRACLFGVPGGARAWNAIAGKKFLCPAPGYDRHFAITEHLGFEMVTLPMRDDGPDMDVVEELAGGDETVLGIWCVPKYHNPTGACYSADSVARLAQMKTAAADFRIMWDNAYAEHHLYDERPALANIAELCARAGNANRVVQFASTSKICHPGSGVAAMAASDENIADARAHLAVQSIGPDKVNQLRLLQFCGTLEKLRAHMQKHAALIRPKFEAALEVLQCELGGLGIAEWSRPRGGYFISVDIEDGCAARAVQLAREAGVTLTAAGAPFPYGKDPRDRNIRIAPTFPSAEEVRRACEVFAVCVKLAVCEKVER